MGYIAAKFYDNPSKHYPVIGITGTNGKTSCSHFIAQILDSVKKPCAVIGTLGNGFLKNLEYSVNTTPHALLLQQLLAKYRDKASAISMEVTSIALEQKRTAGTHFDTVIFTNLSRDHLDYHGDMANYWQEKKSLFLEYPWKHAVINLDDEHGLKLYSELSTKNSIIGFTTTSRQEIDKFASLHKLPNKLITTEHLSYNDSGIHAFIKTPWGEGQLHCSLFGQFNLSNVLASIAAVCLQGVPFVHVMDAVNNLKTVPGRMITLKKSAATPLVIIDFAHTPDALSKVLQAVRAHCRGKIWCVFGCGGDRDRGKRPLMAATAEQYSDNIIITRDNPRTEDVQQIFADMLSGFKKPDLITIEIDRKKAIESAIEKAVSDDIVVIAGKGHEAVLIIQNQFLPFSDEKVAQDFLQQLQGAL
jgi:UDP-N-acetylmuramoyl-L-alanyl-D-glutamate--2,6-diaminopimelate ligase